MKWAWLGLLAGLVGFYILSIFQTAFRPTWIAHAFAISVVLIAVTIVIAQRRAAPRHDARPAPLTVATVGFAAAFLLGLVVSIETLLSVTERAKATAANAPFCIQVADNRRGSYQPADALLDLSGLTLWSLSPVLHHAILVVGDETDPRLFHWSYRQRDFVPGVINWKLGEYEPAVTCLPRHGFADNLPVVFPQTSTTRYVRLSKQDTFRIPDAYQPRWSGGLSRTLSLAAPAPEFAPLRRSWDGLPPRERDNNWVMINWNPDWLLSLMGSTDGRVVEQGTEFGLRKQLIVWRGRDDKDYESHRYFADAGGQPDAVNTTLVHCYPSSEQNPKSCQHRFLNGGRHYYFRHRPEDVPQWQAMQKRLLDLIGSFEVRSADQPTNH